MATRLHNANRILALASTAAAALFLASTSGADIIDIPADYATIQAGIDAAADGDEIIVAPGTYNEAINLAGKAVYLHSSAGSATAVIDATGLDCSVVTCANGEDPSTVLAGFTITGGKAPGEAFPDGCGGGMFVFLATPTVVNCKFVDNVAAYDGGGVYMDANTNASLGGRIVPIPMFLNCAFINNSAGHDGGGFCDAMCGAILRNCTFSCNGAECGGGLCCCPDYSPTMTNCILSGNLSLIHI